jgi:hypothetical protein
VVHTLGANAPRLHRKLMEAYRIKAPETLLAA